MNNRGSALILSYMIIVVLVLLGSAYVASSISESNIARRYSDSKRAFWIAEAGLAQAYHDWVGNPSYSGSTANFGDGSYTVTKSLSSPEVTVTAAFGSSQEVIKANFIRIPHPFENTLSAGGDLTLTGLLARVEVYNKTRISGLYSNTRGATGWFEDKQEGTPQNQTTIPIPDYNNNGTADEFGDFVEFGRQVAASYPSDQVVYLQTDGTVNIFPNSTLLGKKVIFVEGTSPQGGNVNIFFDATWRENEDLTVISTGNITYVEPLQFQEEARLSTVSWGDYSEASVFRSEHESVVYTHDDANFVDILDWGSTTGNVIANDDISLLEVLTYEKYYYSNRALNGDLPPGFQYLSGASGQVRITDWQQP